MRLKVAGDECKSLKRCSKCLETKARESFSKDRTKDDGLQTQCKACKALYTLAIKAESAKRAAKRYAENKEEILKSQARRRSENKASISESNAQYRAKNGMKFRAYMAARRARKRNAGGSYTDKDVERMKYLQKSKCANCKCLLGEFHVDHINPLALGGTNDPANLQLLCPSCNRRKHAKPPEQFAREEGRLI